MGLVWPLRVVELEPRFSPLRRSARLQKLAGTDTGIHGSTQGFNQNVILVAPSAEQFVANFYRVLSLRRLRSLGSYGHLGQVKGKQGFLESLPPAITEIQKLIKTQLPRLERLAGFLGGTN